jgi:hypothetical protein
MSNENAAMSQMAGGALRRDKNWAELTDAEKIERMRQEVKRLLMLVNRHDRGLGRMEEHRHGDGGELLVPLNSRRGMDEQSYRRGEDWF